MHVDIYTDGAARGNPNGPGGYGAIIEFVDVNGKKHIREYSQGYVKTTNNRMELLGVITALEHLTKPCDITVYTDSQYVVNAFNKGWLEGWKKKGWKRSGGPLLNIDLWQRLDKLAANHTIRFEWVKGHAGHPQNERCDLLATTAADGKNLIIDEGLSQG